MPPLAAATDAQLALAVEDNLFDLFRAMAATLPGGEIVEGARFSLHHAFPANPMFNSVWRTALASAEADAAIDEAVAWFQARAAPLMFWWIGPGTQPDDLPERLKARGFIDNMPGDPGFAADLSTVVSDLPAPSGFSIVPVADQKTLADWGRTFVEAFEVPAWAGQSWIDATNAVGFEWAPWKLYLGYLDGRPVATNMVVYGGGVAGLYAVGTVPDVRRRGLGALITVAPLVDARAAGFRYGVLFASELGAPVYRRVGFHEVPTRVGRYLRRLAA
jgi:hypothetical protein